MKRLLLPFVLAVIVATGCGGSSTAPTPIDSLQGPSWQGTVKYSRHSVSADLDETVTLAGAVTWIKETNPDPAPLAGAVSYIIQSGSLTATHTGVVGFCTIQGGTTHLLKPGDGFLVLNPNGTYSGYIHSNATFPSTLSCPGPSTLNLGDDVAPIDLEMNGQVASLRMQGAMEPVTVALSTFTGSWDFSPTR